MTRPFDKHLDSGELDRLSALAAPGEAVSEARRHAETCAECGRRLQVAMALPSEILRMRAPQPSPPTPECMGEAGWLEVAAGLLPPAQARERMRHAAQCGYCGPLLKNAGEALVEETSPAEEKWLAALPSAQPEWRKDMAQRLQDNCEVRDGREGAVELNDEIRAKEPGKQSGKRAAKKESALPWWQGMFAWPRPAFGFAGILIAVAAGWLGWWALHPATAEQLLARAYTEHRTLEVRIPGAAYAPERVERGAAGSSLDKPPALLKAEALIAENLRKHPNDPAWLQAKARADLLDGNADAAIKSLQRALEDRPDDPALLTDLGTAYYVRAEAADRPIDYGNAIEALGKALAKSPDDPVALFNRALACERMFLFTQAVDDWQHYLRIDPQGEWAEDARKRLAAIQEKLREHEKSQNEPLLTPEEIAKAGDDPAVRARIDERIEEYLHVAVTEWLPKAFPNPSARPSSEARAALGLLADVTKKGHSDSWLSDLLSAQTAGKFPMGALALANALTANDRGDYYSARASAQNAARLFRAAANAPAEVRAQAEEVYSDQLLWEGQGCISLLHIVKESLENKQYAWLSAQMDLEESNCANLVSDLGTYQASIAKGMRKAESHGYTPLFLRALGFQSLSDASLGSVGSSFLLGSRGLALFWSSSVDLMKGYNLYYDLASTAEEMELVRLQVVLWREATTLIDQHSDVLNRAMAHRWYGNSAYLAGDASVAAAEFSRASALFAAAPPTLATMRDYIDAEIWQARAEVRQGALDRALDRLTAVKPSLDDNPSFDPEINFYSVEADIKLRRADFAGAESSLRSGLLFAEQALSSYESEDDRRHWAEETGGLYRDAVEWKFRQGDAMSALELWEWYRGADLRAPRRASPSLANRGLRDVDDAPPVPSPSFVSEHLPLLRRETRLTYAILPSGIAVWALDERGVMSHWIPQPLFPTQDLTFRLERLCADPNSDLGVLRKAARSLYGILISPIEQHFEDGRTLLIEPDGYLAAIPWDVLVDSNSRYLAERASVVIAPSFYQATRLRPSMKINRNMHVLIAAVPTVPQEGLVPLADSEQEGNFVAGNFLSALQLTGGSATLAAIRRNLRDASIFHFAGHAVASADRSGLALAEIDPVSRRSRLISSESLAADEVGNLQLAVLSACHSGGGEQAYHSGTDGLATSLLRSGVPHVVASRWNVDSSETANFMRHFYSRLLGGLDVAAAMNATELEMATRPASAHPYFWSAFELRGIR